MNKRAGIAIEAGLEGSGTKDSFGAYIIGMDIFKERVILRRVLESI